MHTETSDRTWTDGAQTLFKVLQQSRATQAAITNNNPLNLRLASPRRTNRSAPGPAAPAPTPTSTVFPASLSGNPTQTRLANFPHFHPFALETRPWSGAPLPSEGDAVGGSGSVSKCSWFGTAARQGSTGSARLRDKQVRANLNRLEDNFFGVAMRISWYPISLILINVLFTGTFGPLYAQARTRTDGR